MLFRDCVFYKNLTRFILLVVAVFVFFVVQVRMVYPAWAVSITCICKNLPLDRACTDHQGEVKNMSAICTAACGTNGVNIQGSDNTCASFCKSNPQTCTVGAVGDQTSGDKKVKSVSLQNPLGSQTDLLDVAGGAIGKALGVLGSITLLVFVAGGVMWLTSAGNPERVKKGSMTMLYAAIGLAVIFSAFAVLSLVIGGLTG